MRRAVVAGLVTMTSIASAQPAAPSERLRDVEEQRGKIEFYLRRVEDKQAQVLAVLDEIERDAREAQAQAAQARWRAVKADEKLGAARVLEASIEAERVAVAHEIGPRLLLRYRLRGSSYVRALLSAPSLGDLLWRRRMVDRILAGDVRLVARLEGVQRQATLARAAVEADRTGLAQAEARAREEAVEAKGRREIQAAVLRGIVREKAGYVRTVSELEHSRRGLLDVLARLPPPPEGLGGFGARRGQLRLPTAGHIEVGYGRQVDRQFGTVLQQKGVDVRAPAGAPVLAPHPGLVGFAGWFRGFGNLVVLDHGEGYYTLYAHLDALNVVREERAPEGALLGTVGDTGSIKGAYLYFEIRSGAKALDPKDWLAK